MQIIFLVYANNRKHPLPTLQEEEEKTYSVLARRSRKQHFNIHRDSFASVDSIIEYLELHRDEIILFSYSGHAERDKLILDDDEANAQGIAGLLGQCQKLKLILLNGCSTAGQVKRLQALPNRPVVIATSAPVGDYSAARFGISFFRELAERHGTIESAFQTGLNAAKTTSKLDIREARGLGLREEVVNLWGIYASDETSLQWKLPVEADEITKRQQTLTWLKWWGAYLLAGIVLLTGTVFLQVSESPLWLNLVPILFFFAPFLPTMRTQLPRKRLYVLIGLHACVYFLLLFLWMQDAPLIYLLYLSLGSAVYFIVLPLLNQRKTPKPMRL